MREQDVAMICIVHVPLLSGFIEANIRGPDDVESSERAEINRFSVEAVDVTAGVEAKGTFHPSPSCC